ncbi:hypothetical protein GZL_07436 [Streptomyces sp. 769]|nr:hypothetical protein GZL_07436 [Streptomyces sp. 769]
MGRLRLLHRLRPSVRDLALPDTVVHLAYVNGLPSVVGPNRRNNAFHARLRPPYSCLPRRSMGGTTHRARSHRQECRSAEIPLPACPPHRMLTSCSIQT